MGSWHACGQWSTNITTGRCHRWVHHAGSGTRHPHNSSHACTLTAYSMLLMLWFLQRQRRTEDFGMTRGETETETERERVCVCVSVSQSVCVFSGGPLWVWDGVSWLKGSCNGGFSTWVCGPGWGGGVVPCCGLEGDDDDDVDDDFS